MFFAFSPFRFRWTLEASRWLQDGPRELQDEPKRSPRRAQERPRASQERPKRAPRGDFSGPEGRMQKSACPCFDRSPPRWPKATSQASPQSLKRAPRGTTGSPKGATDLQHIAKKAFVYPQNASERLSERKTQKRCAAQPEKHDCRHPSPELLF